MTPDEFRAAGHDLIDWLADHIAGIEQHRVSPTVETAPVGPAGVELGSRYLNAAAVLETSLSARELLAHLLTIERSLGLRDGHNGALAYALHGSAACLRAACLRSRL